MLFLQHHLSVFTVLYQGYLLLCDKSLFHRLQSPQILFFRLLFYFPNIVVVLLSLDGVIFLVDVVVVPDDIVEHPFVLFLGLAFKLLQLFLLLILFGHFKLLQFIVKLLEVFLFLVLALFDELFKLYRMFGLFGLH